MMILPGQNTVCQFRRLCVSNFPPDCTAVMTNMPARRGSGGEVRDGGEIGTVNAEPLKKPGPLLHHAAVRWMESGLMSGYSAAFLYAPAHGPASTWSCWIQSCDAEQRAEIRADASLMGLITSFRSFSRPITLSHRTFIGTKWIRASLGGNLWRGASSSIGSRVFKG